jgi:hypothetical protein
MKIENIIRRILREEQEEEKILKIPGIRYFNNDWNILQKFLESQDNPRYSIGGNLDLFRRDDIESLGNLVRVEGDLDLSFSDIETLGNLNYVGGFLSLGYTPLSKKYTIEEIRNMVEVVGKVYL